MSHSHDEVRQEFAVTLMYNQFNKNINTLMGVDPPPKAVHVKKDWTYYKTQGATWNNVDIIPKKRLPFVLTKQVMKGEEIKLRHEREREKELANERSQWCDAVLHERSRAMAAMYERQAERIKLETMSQQTQSLPHASGWEMSEMRRQTLVPIKKEVSVTYLQAKMDEFDRQKEMEFKMELEKRETVLKANIEKRNQRLVRHKSLVKAKLSQRTEERMQLESASGQLSERMGIPPRSAVSTSSGGSRTKSAMAMGSCTSLPHHQSHNYNMGFDPLDRSKSAPLLLPKSASRAQLFGVVDNNVVRVRASSALGHLERPRTPLSAPGTPSSGANRAMMAAAAAAGVSVEEMLLMSKLDLGGTSSPGSRDGARSRERFDSMQTMSEFLSKGMNTTALSNDVPSLVGAWCDPKIKEHFPEY